MFFFAIVLVASLLTTVLGFFLTGWHESLLREEKGMFLGVVGGCQLLFAGLFALAVSYSSTADTENWNGIIVQKQSERVSCEHSYQCFCHESCTGSGKNKSCTQVCQTCYEHSYDVDWTITTSNSEKIEIERVDRQGVETPSRWASAHEGDYTTLPHAYKNYIKASPETLFRHQGLQEKYKLTLPEYPNRIYDYYRLDRLVTVGVDVPDRQAWNADLTRINSELGRAYQVNIIVVLVRNEPADWFYALEEHWIGGKKNDAVLVIGVNDADVPQWANVMAWTTEELFKVKLRDDILDEQVINRSTVMAALSRNVSGYYKRKPMKDFEYLKSQIQPSALQWSLALIIGPLIGIIALFLLRRPFVFA